MAKNILIAFEIMGQGMLGIFTATLFIMLVISVIKKIFTRKENTRV